MGKGCGFTMLPVQSVRTGPGDIAYHPVAPGLVSGVAFQPLAKKKSQELHLQKKGN